MVKVCANPERYRIEYPPGIRRFRIPVTDNDSAKMATSKGVIQGYAAQAAVDSAHQVIVAAEVTGSGSEQAMLLPMIEAAQLRAAHTLITADAGYHGDANMAELHKSGIAALVADGQMRNRDERLAGQQRHKAKADPLHDKRGLRSASGVSKCQKNKIDSTKPLVRIANGVFAQPR